MLPCRRMAEIRAWQGATNDCLRIFLPGLILIGRTKEKSLYIGDKDGKEDKGMRKRTQEMKRIVVSLGLCIVMAVAPAAAVNAQDANEGGTEIEVQELAEYDLEEGGTQSFEIVDEDGEETEIVVEEVPGKARVANKTYKITGRYRKNWTAGFYIDVNSNRITRAHDKFYKATKGSISNVRLLKESDAQATLYFKYSNIVNVKKSKVSAKILNKRLIVKSS